MIDNKNITTLSVYAKIIYLFSEQKIHLKILWEGTFNSVRTGYLLPLRIYMLVGIGLSLTFGIVMRVWGGGDVFIPW
jgi:hypothetical protein